MNRSEQCLLEVLRCATEGSDLNWNEVPQAVELRMLAKLAADHRVLPLVIDHLYNSSFSDGLLHFRQIYQSVKRQTINQTQRTADFLCLLRWLDEQGVSPVVIKGIICRDLYPKPELRASVDEDLLIDRSEFMRYHELLLAYGLQTDSFSDHLEQMDEISYRDQDGHLYIELHMSLFPSNSPAYSDLNSLFEGVLDRQITLKIYGQKIRTLSPTDNFLYLLCHAYKHFLHGGVGIRQLLDMALFANMYDADIEWKCIFSSCQKVHIETFATVLLQIAYKHLTLSAVPISFAAIEIDEIPLLEDILSGGLYGTADIDRAHSSNMTLEAVAARRQGRKGRGVLRSLFPGKKYLQNHYSYAKKYPVLLPVAWAQRIVSYLRKYSKNKGNPAQSIHIGRERIVLLKKYKII